LLFLSAVVGQRKRGNRQATSTMTMAFSPSCFVALVRVGVVFRHCCCILNAERRRKRQVTMGTFAKYWLLFLHLLMQYRRKETGNNGDF